MKSKRHNLFAAALTISLALTMFSAYSVAGDKNAVISKKEFKTLLKTAKEPVEHQKIAAYYRHEAARLNATAKEHQELAAIYQKNPPLPALEAKHGSSVEGVSHCKRWAELSAEQAKEAEALAALHEDMAKAAEQKQQ
jgi:hypothetical protein